MLPKLQNSANQEYRQQQGTILHWYLDKLCLSFKFSCCAFSIFEPLRDTLLMSGIDNRHDSLGLLVNDFYRLSPLHSSSFILPFAN